MGSGTYKLLEASYSPTPSSLPTASCPLPGWQKTCADAVAAAKRRNQEQDLDLERRQRVRECTIAARPALPASDRIAALRARIIAKQQVPVEADVQENVLFEKRQQAAILKAAKFDALVDSQRKLILSAASVQPLKEMAHEQSASQVPFARLSNPTEATSSAAPGDCAPGPAQNLCEQTSVQPFEDDCVQLAHAANLPFDNLPIPQLVDQAATQGDFPPGPVAGHIFAAAGGPMHVVWEMDDVELRHWASRSYEWRRIEHKAPIGAFDDAQSPWSLRRRQLAWSEARRTANAELAAAKEAEDELISAFVAGKRPGD